MAHSGMATIFEWCKPDELYYSSCLVISKESLALHQCHNIQYVTSEEYHKNGPLTCQINEGRRRFLSDPPAN